MELLVTAISGLLAMGFVLFLTKDVLAKDPGNETMSELSSMIQAGARAFLKREYTWVFSFVAVIFILFSVAPLLGGGDSIGINMYTGLAFVCGAVVSAGAGFIGMSIATKANCRTAQAAATDGLKGALSVAIGGGAVMGMSVVGLALLGLCLVYVFTKDPHIVNGYAMGASLMALFARSGGGIYTKGADMGADLVGKVEAGMPEDDPRNPAVIADNVGDNVGDVAGLGADLLESYVESIIASLAIASTLGVAGVALDVSEKLQMLPLYIASAGVVASIIGIFYVRIFGTGNPQKALMMGTYVAAVLATAATGVIVAVLNLGDGFVVAGKTFSAMSPFYATLFGIVAGVIVGYAAEYYTSKDYSPVQILAKNSQSGPAITVTDGMAVGMASTMLPVVVLVIATILAYNACGFYGVAMAALGMLATTGMVVAVDSYGPIADNAGGIAEMAKLPPEVREITDNLDAVGNTTAAIGKGFAIGSAAFAAMGLLSAFILASQAKNGNLDMRLDNVKVLGGLLLGGMLPFYFSSKLFKAVSYSADRMIQEVRRQIREIPGLLEGTAKPDSVACVDIATQGAIRGMLLPGLTAIIVPPVIGFLLGAECLAGLLVGSLVSGLMLGIQSANSGGAMDNAKKFIEEGNYGGKGSEAHKAAVVGDTVGDPLKDTVGPSINILIKLMAVISLVLAPVLTAKGLLG